MNSVSDNFRKVLLGGGETLRNLILNRCTHVDLCTEFQHLTLLENIRLERCLLIVLGDSSAFENDFQEITFLPKLRSLILKETCLGKWSRLF